MSKHRRSLSSDEAPSKRPKAIEPGSCSTSPSASSMPQYHGPAHSRTLNDTITPTSQLENPRGNHQDLPSLFANASGFQINNSTIIGSVVECADPATLPFPDSYDGRKLRKALLKGLEFSLLAQGCMPDTRVTILSEVDARIHDSQGSNIIWIKSFPGVGKSTLASTIVSRLRDQGELLSYFVFDRAKPTTTTTTALWRRVAWDLACLHPFAREPLLKRINGGILDASSHNTASLFASLIIEPLSDLSHGKSSDVQLDQPVVVVIDAVDECGGLEGPRSSDRKALLKTLEQWYSELPKNFKLVVTSREEDDIRRRISPISDHIHISINADEACSDIRKYLEDRLGDIAGAYSELPVDWAHQTAHYLAKGAAGVFMWATIIANFIEAGEPQSRLEDIEAGLGLGGEEGSLFALYANVLKISFKNLHKKETEAFKCVVGVMIFAQRPFNGSEITAISPLVTGSMLEYIRNGLRSVIDQGNILRFVHQSFVDFLLSPECPDEFSIKEAEQQRQLSTLCLTTMSKQLRFNICGLETSSLKNANVPDIETKIKTWIPLLLSYASCFVADHLRHSAFDEHLMGNVRVVFKEKLLYWLEVMSLLNEMKRTVPILRAVVDWISARDEDLTEYIRDALRFVTAFITPISQSAPHIYLSALPFAPEESLVAKHFLPRFPQLLALDTGKHSHWSSCVFVSEYHRKRVTSIAFSPDEKIFASGSEDGRICVCDSETGILIFCLSVGDFMLGPPSSVNSLDFSPDGKEVVAAYGKDGLVIWNIENFWGIWRPAPVNDEVWEDEDIVSAVYAKDGNNTIVSISRSPIHHGPSRIQLWDANSVTLSCTLLDPSEPTERSLLSPDAHFLAESTKFPRRLLRVWDLTERPPRCVIELDDDIPLSLSTLAFSPDGQFLLVVTYTPQQISMARIWKMETCNMAGPAISLHPETGGLPLYHLLYSDSNDNLAIAVYGDASTQIFDGTTGDIVYWGREPSRVSSGSPSRSGRRALVGYGDGTIRMWDHRCHVRALSPIDPTADNHMVIQDWAKLVFSPCGKTLAVSDGDEIRLWNTVTGEAINLSHPIRTKHRELAFSGDGSGYIASLTLCGPCRVGPPVINIWDTSTGMNHRCLAVTCANSERDYELFFSSSDNQLVLSSTTPSSGGSEREGFMVRVWGDYMLGDACTTVMIPDLHYPFWPIIFLSPDALTTVTLEHTYVDTIVHCQHRNTIEERFVSRASFNAAALGKTSNMKGRATFSQWSTICIGSRQRRRSTSNSSMGDKNGGAVWVWDICNGKRVSEPWRGYDLSRASSIIISPDGEKLASIACVTTSRIVRLWDTRGLHSGQAQGPVGGVGDFGDQTLVEDGWIGEGSNSLLFWVPSEHRDGLWRPRNIAVFGVTPTKLNFSAFKYGKEWEECIDKEYMM
ncbi:hypothetical protein D9756_002787 [Leucocoprinus leucothites]|uniref:Nephrocystin 3-like N-terminal domain-containing protein n=1 Tax=Leucocoprinus leucothites TaxID=201217 RepID=A0A8H5LLX6_9AGAR|nr:hypothetical protein D9756_002787 [Leucoagaricus leucothites]